MRSPMHNAYNARMEVCRRSGAWGARRVGKMTLPYSINSVEQKVRQALALADFYSAHGRRVIPLLDFEDMKGQRIMKKCVIVGAGVCDSGQLRKRAVIKEGDLCIAADGGLDYLLEAGIPRDIVLGDMDSLRTREALAALSVKRLPEEKDDTDMLAAIKEGLSAGFRKFELYGALGGRLDHTLANIQSLLYLLNRGARGTLYGDGLSVFLIRNESISFVADEAKCGRRISVFAFGGDADGVSEVGLKYTLDHVLLKQEFPVGVSNEFTGRHAMIEVQNGMLLICMEIK